MGGDKLRDCWKLIYTVNSWTGLRESLTVLHEGVKWQRYIQPLLKVSYGEETWRPTRNVIESRGFLESQEKGGMDTTSWKGIHLQYWGKGDVWKSSLASTWGIYPIWGIYVLPHHEQPFSSV